MTDVKRTLEQIAIAAEDICRRLEKANVKNAELIAHMFARGQGGPGLAMAAILEIGMVLDWNNRKAWEAYLKEGETSDLILQGRIFMDCYQLRANPSYYGLLYGKYKQAVRVYEDYVEEAQNLFVEFPDVAYDEEAQLEAIKEGMPGRLYVLTAPARRGNCRYLAEAGGEDITMSNTSIHARSCADFLLGVELPIHTKGGENFNVITSCAVVDLDWIRSHHPEVIDEHLLVGLGYFDYNAREDQVYGVQETWIFGEAVDRKKVPVDSCEKQAQIVFKTWLWKATVGRGELPENEMTSEILAYNRLQMVLASKINDCPEEIVFLKDSGTVLRWYNDRLEGIARFGDLSDIGALRFPDVEEIMHPKAEIPVEAPAEVPIEAPAEASVEAMVGSSAETSVESEADATEAPKTRKKRTRAKREPEAASI